MGSSYSSTLSASGGSGSYTWAATGLPAGLSISAAGAITGTPTVTGTFLVHITVTDSNNMTSSTNLNITIGSASSGGGYDSSNNSGTVSAALSGSVVDANGNVVNTAVVKYDKNSGTAEVQLGFAAVNIPGNLFAASKGLGNQTFSLTISKANKQELSTGLQGQIGDKPIIAVDFQANSFQRVAGGSGSGITVSFFYTHSPEELKKHESITVWSIDGNSNASPVTNGRFDPSTGRVTFNTFEPGKFAVVYVSKTFSDLTGFEWARKAIEVMASKGIINGTAENMYSPSGDINRADYLMLLVKTLGLAADFDENFDDVQQGDYYYRAVGIAKKLGITGGAGNNRFNPRENISRQDMMVLTARALEKFKELKANSDKTVLEKFSDKGAIAPYAEDSFSTMVREGLVSGDGAKLNPHQPTTRAETAVFLYNIYCKY